MIPLAATGGSLVFFVVFAVVGVINWWLEKKKKGAQSDSPQPPRPSARPSASGGGDVAEQERLRRFLEALGVPQQPPPSPPQPQRQIPATPKPQPQPKAVNRKRDRQAQAAKSFAKPAQQMVRHPARPAFSDPEEMQRAGRLEESASSTERISSEFGEMNVRVTMPPGQAFDTPAHLATANAGTTSVLERSGNPLVASLRHTLTNPTGVRAAFLAAELLGPPKGLQK